MLNCRWLSEALVFDQKNISFCCSGGVRKIPPLFPYLSSPEATIANFINTKKLIYEELQRGNDELVAGCRGCPYLTESDSDEIEIDKIAYINLSFYPSVCQSKCIYCGYADNEVLNNYEEAKETKYAEYLSGIMPYLKENGYLNEAKLYIQCSSGEITIHPHKDMILDSIKSYYCGFFTNAFIYDKKIADILRNTKSFVQTDLDAGSRETYKVIKGFDMFDKTLENLRKYKKSGGVLLKYLVIPGVNDGDKDFDGIVDILKSLGLKKLLISKDNRQQSSEHWEKTCRSVAILMRKLVANGINYELVPVFGGYEKLVFEYYNGELSM